MEGEDFYAVLGIEGGGPQVSQLEVRKAYRNRALVWHPDKQVGKKPLDVAFAAAKFEKIRRALDVLGDEKARKAYDNLRELQKRRLERKNQLSSKRQKMMQDLRDRAGAFKTKRSAQDLRDREGAFKTKRSAQDLRDREGAFKTKRSAQDLRDREGAFETKRSAQDLREREGAFETKRSARREEALAINRLQAEIARIREANKRRSTGQGLDFSVLAQPSGQSQNGKSAKTQHAPAATLAQALEMQNTLEVTWTNMEGGLGGYTATSLKEIFEEFGAVEDVVIRESKSRSKGSALVVMTSKEGAIAAINVHSGDFFNPLRASLMPSTNTRIDPEVASQAAPAQDGGIGNVDGSGYRSYENDILRKMRQAAERARIIKEIQEEDAKVS